MKFKVDNYFLAYTDGQQELQIPLAGPTSLLDVLGLAHIQAWEEPVVKLNGQPCTDMAAMITDQDELYVSKT